MKEEHAPKISSPQLNNLRFYILSGTLMQETGSKCPLEIYLLEGHTLPWHSPAYKLLTQLPDSHTAAGLSHPRGSLLTAGAGEPATVRDDSSSQLCRSHWYRESNRTMKRHSTAWFTSSPQFLWLPSPVVVFHIPVSPVDWECMTGWLFAV